MLEFFEIFLTWDLRQYRFTGSAKDAARVEDCIFYQEPRKSSSGKPRSEFCSTQERQENNFPENAYERPRFSISIYLHGLGIAIFI